MSVSDHMVIAVDGPAASGKGTLSRGLAGEFGLARLDTGLIYRAVGFLVVSAGGNPSDLETAVWAAKTMSLKDLDNKDLRTEVVASAASKVAAIHQVRTILLKFQRNFATNPPNGTSGVVLDGRDIGTVVCPKATYKIFLSADTQVRAKRRYKQLQESGSEVIYDTVLQDILDRDERDLSRSVSPLKPAEDAFVIDSNAKRASEVFLLAQKFIKAEQ